MSEMFTDKARSAMVLAAQEAISFRHQAGYGTLIIRSSY